VLCVVSGSNVQRQDAPKSVYTVIEHGGGEARGVPGGSLVTVRFYDGVHLVLVHARPSLCQALNTAKPVTWREGPECGRLLSPPRASAGHPRTCPPLLWGVRLFPALVRQFDLGRSEYAAVSRLARTLCRARTLLPFTLHLA
jgi:hypothetical protein